MTPKKNRAGLQSRTEPLALACAAIRAIQIPGFAAPRVEASVNGESTISGRHVPRHERDVMIRMFARARKIRANTEPLRRATASGIKTERPTWQRRH